MRVYLPATVADLSAPAITSRQAHAATASLAADSSVIAISEQDEAQKRYRRVVIAADVERENLRELEVDDETLPGTVQVLVDVPWDDVAAVLADEDQASADVKLAAEGDEEAFERSADADLLWFDVCEVAVLAKNWS